MTKMTFAEDPSLRDVGALYVMMKPSRVLQILINFITNAINFTRDQPKR
jgi:C4-dicarboxylate-specific signal transduction histidine kinase